MAKKKRQDTPAKPQVFHTTPFSALKGVAVSPATDKEPETPLPAAPPPAREADGVELFLRAMDGVRKLDAGPSAARSGAQPPKPVHPSVASDRVAEIDRTEQEAFTRAIGQLKLDVTFADSLPVDEELKPLGANRLRQLKKGVIRVDRQLDLHGLTRDEALEALPRFLRNARMHGEKAVLVITGKGYNSPGEPVLQQAVAAWLRDAGREFVVEFTPAPREMGGSGAFVAFLRGSQSVTIQSRQ